MERKKTARAVARASCKSPVRRSCLAYEIDTCHRRGRKRKDRPSGEIPIRDTTVTYRQITFNLGALVLLLALLGLVYWQHTGARAVPGSSTHYRAGDLQTQMLAAQGLRHIGQPAQAAVPVLIELAIGQGRSSIQTEAAGALPPIDLSAARKVMVRGCPSFKIPIRK